mmetsp:Transcript_2292/g.6816  ORF Transcript_2292/g.6816 Transcript_2292/m.6816 type:complete len:209 (-) Transcript_2292:288-914(-)
MAADSLRDVSQSRRISTSHPAGWHRLFPSSLELMMSSAGLVAAVHHSIGTGPSSWFLRRLTLLRGSTPSSEGTVPESPLSDRSRVVSDGNKPISEGIDPVRRLSLRANVTSDGNKPISEGIEPFSRLPFRIRVLRDFKSPMSGGIAPVSSFCVKTSACNVANSKRKPIGMGDFIGWREIDRLTRSPQVLNEFEPNLTSSTHPTPCHPW